MTLGFKGPLHIFQLVSQFLLGGLTSSMRGKEIQLITSHMEVTVGVKTSLTRVGKTYSLI